MEQLREEASTELSMEQKDEVRRLTELLEAKTLAEEKLMAQLEALSHLQNGGRGEASGLEQLQQENSSLAAQALRLGGCFINLKLQYDNIPISLPVSMYFYSDFF